MNPQTEEGKAVLVDVFHFQRTRDGRRDERAAVPEGRVVRRLLYLILHGIDFAAPEHCFRRTTSTSSSAPLPGHHAPASRGRSSRSRRVPAQSLASARGRRADAPDHRLDGRQLPARDREAERALDELEEQVFERRAPNLARTSSNFKKDVASLRRVVQPQRDVVGRLARREFPLIDEQCLSVPRRARSPGAAADESMFFQDRITSLLDANLATVSNQLNTIMKI
jgi:magnesium transporter